MEKNVKMIEQLVHNKVLTSDEAKIKLNEISERLDMLKGVNNNVLLESITNYKFEYGSYRESSQVVPYWIESHDNLIIKQKDLSEEIINEVHAEYRINNTSKHEIYNQCLIILVMFSLSTSTQFIIFRAGLALAGLFYFLHINYQLNQRDFKFLKIKYIIFRPIAFSCLFAWNLYIGLPNNEQQQIEVDNGILHFQMISLIFIFLWTFDKSLRACLNFIQ